MRHLHALIASSLLASVTAGCAAHTVGVHTATTGPGAARYRTFTVESVPGEGAGTTVPGAFTDLVLGTTEIELTKRGLRRTEGGAPADLVVRYRLAIEPRLATASGAGRTDPCRKAGCSEELVTYERSTLVFDVVEATSEDILWRGWSQHRWDDLHPVRSAQTAELVRASVGRVFARFPFRGGTP